MIMHVNSAPKDTRDQYEKGDLVIRDDANHIEFITKLVTLLKKETDTNFLKIINQNLDVNSQNSQYS